MKARKINEDEIAAILVRCQKNEKAALTSLYIKVSSLLHHFAMGIVHNDALSCEIIQDSFIQIWENVDSFDVKRGTPLSWMRTIVRNKAIDKLRAENKHLRWRFADGEEHIDEIQSDLDTQPDEALVRIQLHHFFATQFERLPKDQSISLRLAYLHGYSRNELADMLNTNVNTVKSWLRRGANSIRNQDCEVFE
ncbi:RNA polymerase sigma factor [Glaciecola sp. 1036]|uniref:RNA polymerase sigma factor n=1 Tax=Alteromonadaceae TaxID=72275 RepID=UPI003CFEE393